MLENPINFSKPFTHCNCKDFMSKVLFRRHASPSSVRKSCTSLVCLGNFLFKFPLLKNRSESVVAQKDKVMFSRKKVLLLACTAHDRTWRMPVWDDEEKKANKK